MERAVVLIGVGRPHGLEPLPATNDGITAMQGWALGQGLGAGRVITLTDEFSPVTIRDVQDAVTSLVETGRIEQLLIHFCGHGLVVHGSEVWLLSDAMRFGGEAISVGLSRRKAMKGLIPHVVMVSDACRSAPTTLPQAEAVGSAIFEDQSFGKRCYVDLLFATELDAPALQIPSSLDGKSTYEAVYTVAVASSLSGDYPDIVEVDGQGAAVVKVGRLYRGLPAVVTRKLATFGLRFHQTPDGEVTYDTGDEVVSRLLQPPVLEPDAPSEMFYEFDLDHYVRPDSGFLLSPEPGAVLDADSLTGMMRRVDQVEADQVEILELLSDRVPRHFAGIRVVGDGGVRMDSFGPAEQIEEGLFLVEELSTQVVPVLLTLSDGRAFPIWHKWDHMVTVIVLEDVVVDVIYSPTSTTTSLPVADRVRIGVLARRFRQWWDEESPEDLVRTYTNWVRDDPGLGVLVAHALFTMGRPDLIAVLLTYSSLPDVFLLAGVENPNGASFPMYSRTWGLLGTEAFQGRVVRPNVFDSPWALYQERNASEVANNMFNLRRRR